MLHTAAETATRARWPRGGAVPFLRSGPVSPGPQVHAYRAGEETTLCSLPLRLLLWEQFGDLDFTTTPRRDRCQACATLAEA